MRANFSVFFWLPNFQKKENLKRGLMECHENWRKNKATDQNEKGRILKGQDIHLFVGFTFRLTNFVQFPILPLPSDGGAVRVIYIYTYIHIYIYTYTYIYIFIYSHGTPFPTNGNFPILWQGLRNSHRKIPQLHP